MIRRTQTETIICDRCGAEVDKFKFYPKGTAYTAFWNNWKTFKSPGDVTAFFKMSGIDGEISKVIDDRKAEMYGIQIEFSEQIRTYPKLYDLCPDCVEAFKKFMKGDNNV